MNSRIRTCILALATMPALLLRAADLPPSTAAVTPSTGTPRGNTFFVADAPSPEARPGVHFRRLDREPHEMENVTFLGVETTPVSATLIAQLSLPDKAGLVVVQVVPESPASGVLQPNDILLKLDDQILVDERQLSVLVRNHQPGDEISLSYLRAGKPATAKVKLVQHNVPKFGAAWKFKFHALSPHGDSLALMGDDNREDVDRVLSLIDADRKEGARGGERAPHGLSAVRVDPANSNLVFTDDHGALELTIKDGKKTLVAKDAKGQQVFSGPVTTPKEREALPADLRARLEKLEDMQDMSFRTDGHFEGGKTMLYHPSGEPIRWISRQPAPPPHDVF